MDGAVSLASKIQEGTLGRHVSGARDSCDARWFSSGVIPIDECIKPQRADNAELLVDTHVERGAMCMLSHRGHGKIQRFVSPASVE